MAALLLFSQNQRTRKPGLSSAARRYLSSSALYVNRLIYYVLNISNRYHRRDTACSAPISLTLLRYQMLIFDETKRGGNPALPAASPGQYTPCKTMVSDAMPTLLTPFNSPSSKPDSSEFNENHVILPSWLPQTQSTRIVVASASKTEGRISPRYSLPLQSTLIRFRQINYLPVKMVDQRRPFLIRYAKRTACALRFASEIASQHQHRFSSFGDRLGRPRRGSDCIGAIHL